METRQTLYVTDREEWRAWLAKHHASENEVWLIYYKKESGQPRIPYDHAVEEALCFGWIDSIVKTVDDEKFMQRFTPRRAGSQWSALNKRRVSDLIRNGRMTDAGLAKIDATARRSKRRVNSTDAVEIPRVIKQALMARTQAWKNFQSLTPSRQRAYVRLITDAKQEETRERRVREVIARLEQNTGDPDAVPAFMKKKLMTNAKAWENFRKLAPSYRRHYVGWIMQAKQEETRERRLKEAISLLEQNKKLGLK